MFNRGASEQLYFMSRAAVRQSPWSPTRLCQRGDVTCNCAHPSPCNRAARRSRGLWRLARFQAAAHQVCELNNSSAAQSVTFFFAGVPGRRATLTIHTDGGETPWAVSERAHRPRPCSDNPPPHEYSHMYSCRNGTSLCEEHFAGETCFLLFFLARDGRKFSSLDWIWKWDLFFLSLPSNVELWHGARHCVRAPRLWWNWGVESAFPQWDECVWVEVKSLADGSVELSSSRLSVGRRTGTGLFQQGTD